ncbi:GAK system CofD-like protein [Marinomonas algicola]|uniref:GAK system CofD-like protein n=1 Tax=Marinomonas algicola TaxID=2773454 RepID=UPI00174841B9|nr:GAK system CofD-like protein [Marinomonas algicola]
MDDTSLVWRKFIFPDQIRIQRCKKMPELGPQILFFSGGTALNKISRALKYYTHNSIHLVTPFDSGGSSARLREEFTMPAVGDLRSRLMALADETVLGQPDVFNLFNYRLDKQGQAAELRNELDSIVAGTHELIQPITEPMRQLIRTQLAIILSKISSRFELRGASIGNLIIAGGYLNNQQQLDPIVFLFSRLVKALGTVQTIADSIYCLAAELENGEIVIGQHNITGKESDPLRSPIKRIFLNESPVSYCPIPCEILPDRKDMIINADIICYPPGSFYSSVLANILPLGVADSILNNPNLKVYLPNLGVDPEQLGMGLLSQVEAIIKAVSNGSTLDAKGILDFLILDEAHYQSETTEELDTIRKLGVGILVAPLVKEASLYYDEEAVCQFLVSLV